MQSVTKILKNVSEQGRKWAALGVSTAAAVAAVAGAAAGAAVMLTRNLGLSHAAEEAERAKAAGKSADDKAGA